MTTLSLVCGTYGYEDLRMGSTSYFGRGYLGCEFLKAPLGGVNGFLSKSLKGRMFGVIARAKKGKKHDYPWPDDIDPNIKSGYLSYLSSFKPLTEKPKPVTLPFEKPLVDLEKKIIDVRRMADETGLDFSDQIGALEQKYQQALKNLYKHLTPIQRLSIARHPNRPTVLDHILNITDKWVELHGDRAGYDDPAIVTGIGSMDGKSYMFIGHQKGRNTKENIARNFAMPTPHGYRKALRMMKYADHHGFPIVTFVDTPGAFADLKSEELGQGEAIAYNLRAMFGFKVPIVTVVTGEGGSGGALAIACANKLFMLENSAFYVASPEACAAILWKSSQAAPKAAEKLKITAQEHYKLKIADGIIPEPLGGAHRDPAWTSHQIKIVISQAMEELTKMDTEDLLRHRMLKFRHIGGFQEGIPVDPEIKRNMKHSEVNMLNASDVETELEKLKNIILQAEVSNDPIASQTMEKLKQELDKEITNAFISMGLQDKLKSLKLELTYSQDDKPLSQSFQDKVDKIMQEFNLKLSRPGAYLGLKQKLEKLNTVTKLIERKEKNEKLKTEINRKVPAEVKAKTELLKQAQEQLSKGDPLDDSLVEEVSKAKKELMDVLKAANLEIVGLTKRKTRNAGLDLRKKIANVNKEISDEIKKAINVKGLGAKIEELKSEAVSGSGISSTTREKLEAEIKEEILSALDITSLKEKIDDLKQELASSVDSVDEERITAENGRY